MSGIPQWFNVISIVYHIISFLVAGAISYLGYKAYRLIKEKKYLNFSVAFFFIMLSFVVLALTNLIVYLNLDKSVAILTGIISSGFIVYSLLTIGGFFLLVILTFKIKDIKLIAILTAAIIAALVFFDFIKIFHLILLLLALLLSYFFYNNCMEKKTTNSKLVFFAFLAMMVSHVFHIVSSYVMAASTLIYVMGTTLLVLGYILLLIALLRFK
jgi:hypothetical protein